MLRLTKLFVATSLLTYVYVAGKPGDLNSEIERKKYELAQRKRELHELGEHFDDVALVHEPHQEENDERAKHIKDACLEMEDLKKEIADMEDWAGRTRGHGQKKPALMSEDQVAEMIAKRIKEGRKLNSEELEEES